MHTQRVRCLAADRVRHASGVRPVPRNCPRQTIIGRPIWKPRPAMKRRRPPRAARKLPLGFSRQTQSCRRIEVLNRVPRDLLNRTRRAVRLPLERGRVRSHLRLPLRLRDFVAAEVIGVGERHRVDGLFK